MSVLATFPSCVVPIQFDDVICFTGLAHHQSVKKVLVLVVHTSVASNGDLEVNDWSGRMARERDDTESSQDMATEEAEQHS